MNDEIFGVKLVEAVGLLKEIKQKNEQQNASIDAFMKKLVEDLGENMKEGGGEEQKDESAGSGMNPEKFIELLREMERATKQREEDSKKALPPTPSGTGLGEIMDQLLTSPTPPTGSSARRFGKTPKSPLTAVVPGTTTIRAGAGKKLPPPVPTPSPIQEEQQEEGHQNGTSEVEAEVGSVPADQESLEDDGSGGTMGGFGPVPTMKNEVPEVKPAESVAPAGQVWCAVCEEYHNSASDPDAHD